MYECFIVTPWVQDGGLFRPKLTVDFPLLACHDVTGQMADVLTPDPNAYTALVRCDETTLAAIEAAGYAVLSVEEVSSE